MKILITGGTGFLGKATAIRLQEQGHEISVLGRNPKTAEPLLPLGIRFIKADTKDQKAISAATANQDIVIHCAALASPWGPYQNFFDANVIGTKNIVMACLEHKVKRLVNISTPSVYFNYKNRILIKESDPMPPKQVTYYGATKLLADQEVLKGMQAGLEAISLRPRAIFGPGDENILGRLIKMNQAGKLALVGKGSSYVDMTYIDNAVDAIELAIQAPKECLGRVFNISNGEPITVKGMLELLFSRLKINPKVRSVPYPVAMLLATLTEALYRLKNSQQEPPLTRYAVGLMSRSQTLDISLAKSMLRYEPKISLSEGFDRYAKWWLNK